MLLNLNNIRRPPKEGRSRPGLPCMEQKRRCQALSKKTASILVVIVILMRIALHLLGSEKQNANITRLGEPSVLNVHQTRSSLATAIRTTGEEDAAGKMATLPKGSTVDVRGSAAKFVETLKKPKAPSSWSSSSTGSLHPKDFSISKTSKEGSALLDGTQLGMHISTFDRQEELEDALSRVIHLLPGEMLMRDLLRPVEGTGKDKLREMGLRTRSYHEYFDAWEKLHLTTDAEGVTHIRDDIVWYLTQLGSRGDDTRQKPGILSTTSIGQLIRAYETYKYFLAQFGQLLFPYTAPFAASHMSLHVQFKRAGRGIVLTAGDAQAHFLMTTIYSFRQLGCTLPVEVMYLGDSDLSEDYRAELESIGGVVTRDVSQMVNDEGWKLAGWAIKPFAMLLSSFREVIFIDADSAFFQNPEVLFEDPAYQKTGALFFKDRLFMPELRKRWVQQVLPKPFSSQVKQNRFWTGESSHMQESGVVVVDKWQHFMALLLVTRMNGPDRDGEENKGTVGVYDMVYGDKETFWLGWELSGDFRYSFHGGQAGTMGQVNITHAVVQGAEDNVSNQGSDEPLATVVDGEEKTLERHTICAPQLLHLDTRGRPLWFNGWVLDNKFVDKSHQRFATFENYVVEPPAWEGQEPWQLQHDNMCCLTTNPSLKFDFSREEKETLNMIIHRAREVEAVVVS